MAMLDDSRRFGSALSARIWRLSPIHLLRILAQTRCLEHQIADDQPTEALDLEREGITLTAPIMNGGGFDPKEVPLYPGGFTICVTYPRQRRRRGCVGRAEQFESKIFTFPDVNGGVERIQLTLPPRHAT
ncbi:hypothetical protein D9758_001572 [Tetrapyrgos nigripes]|uniref:Uncharacterized protein n=1 Tax=Tetrapyrgos nigripes TaxID=182062 RepID=A0A8H5LX80_9AGAR|nr:hypothetical protein D9758_001572 [Tetrapyrgos nigripes]